MAGDNLFAQDNHAAEPLAARMRPRFLDEFVGQEHILGHGKLLRRAIQADMLSSVIFYGPPGTGKTTLARVIANTTKSNFISLNAVLAGVKDVRESIDQAKTNLELYDRRTILFVDEVHRWNKAQQDALLPWVENGTVVLIGATTHNPFFEVNGALVSRSRIFQLKPLTDTDLRAIVRGALEDPLRGYGQMEVRIDEEALVHLVSVAGGDARGLLGALQLAVETSVESFPPPPGTVVVIDRAIAEDSIQQKAVLYDKEGDYHFDVISAFIKSIRGSDPDAALYWLAKMVYSGEDPRFIFRRMLISASEDVGLADPHALSVVESATAAFERIGLPEGRFHLAHAALYLATCPKSNSTLGFFDAIKAVETEPAGDVPNHLRDASRDKEAFGHGEGYLYPHAYADHWVAQAYLPDGLQGRLFYQPSDQGYESQVRDRVLRLREIQMEVGLPEGPLEVLSYSESGDRDLDRWLARAEQDRTRVLATLRDLVMERARIARHHSVLLGGHYASLVLWDALRAAPEGHVVALISDPRRCDAARHHADQAHPLSRPVILNASDTPLAAVVEATRGGSVPTGSDWRSELSSVRFERIVLVDPAQLTTDWGELFMLIGEVGAARAELTLAQRIPRSGQRLSELVTLTDESLGKHLLDAEQVLFDDPDSPMLSWTKEAITAAANGSRWEWQSTELVDVPDRRTITATQLRHWLSPDRESGLGGVLARNAGEDVRARIAGQLETNLAGQTVSWRLQFLVATASLGEPGS
jgi:putative ATPase